MIPTLVATCAGSALGGASPKDGASAVSSAEHSAPFAVWSASVPYALSVTVTGRSVGAGATLGRGSASDDDGAAVAGVRVQAAATMITARVRARRVAVMFFTRRLCEGGRTNVNRSYG